MIVFGHEVVEILDAIAGLDNEKKTAVFILGLIMNKAEEFVANLCTKSFLSLWSYPNPQGKDSGKELCDFLVVYDPDVIIFSVKEIGLKEEGDESINWKRWHKKAIEESVNQIYGAERFISNSPRVVTKDSASGLNFPDNTRIKVHRIAVALGGKGKGVIRYGDFGKGFVHVLDEISLQTLMSELDTITDFVHYLTAKETLIKSGKILVPSGGEEDLLAFYLSSNRQFPPEPTMIVLDDNLWSTFRQSNEYQAKKIADIDSYIWDRLIEIQCEDYRVAGATIFDTSIKPIDNNAPLATVEPVLRVMAKESRFCRRVLGKSFKEFGEVSVLKKVRSRIAISPSGVQYVFLKTQTDGDLKPGLAELGARCFIARGINQNYKTVIGLLEQELLGVGFNFNFLHLHMEDWTDEDHSRMELLQKELGYFSSPRKTQSYEQEYLNQ